MQQQAVKKRDVVFVCGYEIARPEGHHRRFAKELPLFEAAWNVKTDLSPPSMDSKTNVAIWKLKTSGPNWQVDTNYRMFWWGDIIAPDFDMSNVRRFYVGILALLDFVFSGAIIEYFRVNWRYALFFLYPYVFMAMAGFAGFYLTRWAIGGVVPLANLIAVAVGLACAFVMVALPPRPLYIGYVLNDWHFAHELVYRRRVALDQRLDSFARELVQLVRTSTADEILIVGHSLGAVQAIDVVARARRLDPDFATRKPVRIMTIGSSLLKIGLHPKAKELRDAVREVANDPNIYWAEFQAMTDIVNFYKSNPVTDLGWPLANMPIVQIVRVKHMLKTETYRGLKRDFFRVHRQFVMGNEKRYFYDYYMICAGPVALPQRVVYHEGSIEAFAADGSFDPAKVETGKISQSEVPKPKKRKAP